MIRRPVAAIVGALSIALAASACGSDGGAPATTPVEAAPDTAATAPATTEPAAEPLTPAQANALSRALFLNFQAGGATVEARVPFGASTFVLNADIDWKRHVGAGTLTTLFTDGVRRPETQEIYWSSSVIALPLPGLEAAMAERGRPGVRLVARPLAGSTATVDRIVAFLDAIASDRPENPLLLRQKPEVGYLGREDVDGVAADRYRSSESAQFWLSTAPGPTSGRIVAVRAQFAGLDAPVEVRVRDHGARDLRFPSDDAVVSAAEIPELYAELTAAAKSAGAS